MLTKLSIAAATLALAATPAALAANNGGGNDTSHGNKPATNPSDSKGKGKSKPKNVVLKGVVVSSDATTVTVTVKKATKFGRSLVGTDAQFTVAKVAASDVNGDGVVNTLDLAAGDKVVVQARIAATDTAPYAARTVVDQTHPKDSSGDDQQDQAPAQAPTS